MCQMLKQPFLILCLQMAAAGLVGDLLGFSWAACWLQIPVTTCSFAYMHHGQTICRRVVQACLKWVIWTAPSHDAKPPAACQRAHQRQHEAFSGLQASPDSLLVRMGLPTARNVDAACCANAGMFPLSGMYSKATLRDRHDAGCGVACLASAELS